LAEFILVGEGMRQSHFFRVVGLGIVFLSLTIGLGIAAYHTWVTLRAEPYSFYGTVLTQPRPLPSIHLESTQDYPLDMPHLQGHWTFLFMGFSHCASICPVTMAELAKMRALLPTTLPQPMVVMVTLDPKRDSIERMRDYVHSFHPDFVGARGSEKEVHDLARYLGIAYTQINSNIQKHANDYSIEHSGAIMLLNPHAELVAFFTPPHQAARLVQDYQQLTQRD
jgi:protein SCO1/2